MRLMLIAGILTLVAVGAAFTAPDQDCVDAYLDRWASDYAVMKGFSAIVRCWTHGDPDPATVWRETIQREMENE